MRETIKSILHTSRADKSAKNGPTDELRERLYDYSSAYTLAVMKRADKELVRPWSLQIAYP